MIDLCISKDTPIGVLITPSPVYSYPYPGDKIASMLQIEPTLPCAGIQTVTTDRILFQKDEIYSNVLLSLPDNWQDITTKEFNHVSFDIQSIDSINYDYIDIIINPLDPTPICRQDPLPTEGIDFISPQINIYFNRRLENIFNYYSDSYVTFFSYNF